MNGHEALTQLQQEERKHCLNEINSFQKNPESFLSTEFHSPAQFLLEAFYWSESQQGHEYWADIFEALPK